MILELIYRCASLRRRLLFFMSKRNQQLAELDDFSSSKQLKLSTIDIITDNQLHGVGNKFHQLSSLFNKFGVSKHIPVDKIESNNFRVISEEGIAKLQASLLFHSNKNKEGKIEGAHTRIYVCISPNNKNNFMICDGNHRLEVWRRNKWRTIPAVVLQRKLSIEEIELFAEHQNMLNDIFTHQRTQLQILNRTIYLINLNKNITSNELFEKYKSTYFSKDTCRRYFTLSNLIISKKLENFMIDLERNLVSNKFKISKLFNSKLSQLSGEELKEVFNLACTIATKGLLNYIFLFGLVKLILFLKSEN